MNEEKGAVEKQGVSNLKIDISDRNKITPENECEENPKNVDEKETERK